jgi:hypothetical protein
MASLVKVMKTHEMLELSEEYGMAHVRIPAKVAGKVTGHFVDLLPTKYDDVIAGDLIGPYIKHALAKLGLAKTCGAVISGIRVEMAKDPRKVVEPEKAKGHVRDNLNKLSEDERRAEIAALAKEYNVTL